MASRFWNRDAKFLFYEVAGVKGHLILCTADVNYDTGKDDFINGLAAGKGVTDCFDNYIWALAIGKVYLVLCGGLEILNLPYP